MSNTVIYVKHGVVSLITKEEALALRTCGVRAMALHAGGFHHDGVSAATVASRVFDEVLIYRLFNIDDENAYDYIVDIGRRYDGAKWFDHHQDDIKKFVGEQRHSLWGDVVRQGGSARGRV